MNPLRILVADDHEIVRRGLVFLLKSHPGWDVCGEARDGRQAVEKAVELRPDIVILDIGMPNLNGLEAARQLLRHNPQCKVLILTIADTDEVVRAVLDAGAGIAAVPPLALAARPRRIARLPVPQVRPRFGPEVVRRAGENQNIAGTKPSILEIEADQRTPTLTPRINRLCKRAAGLLGNSITL